MKKVIRGRGWRLGLVTFAILAAFAGVAYGTSVVTRTAATSVITACQLNGIGTIRLVADAARCNPKYETAISWNTSGPAGLAGTPGYVAPECLAPGGPSGSRRSNKGAAGAS